MITLEAIGTFAALVAALAAIYAVISESQLSRFALGFDLITRMNDRFDSPPFHAVRSKAASFLKNINTSNDEVVNEIEVSIVMSPSESLELEQVLDFFEYLALLVARKVIDPEIAWNQ